MFSKHHLGYSYTPVTKVAANKSDLEDWFLSAPEDPQDAGVHIFNSCMLISRPVTPKQKTCLQRTLIA